MNIGWILLKAAVRVRPYQRRKTGRMVAGYTKQTKYPARVKKLYEQHHPSIQKWATISHAAQRAKGVHFQSADDAIQAGVEEGLDALRRYNEKHGPVEHFVRPSIKYGIMKHLAWERSRGMTGMRTLYDLLHRQGLPDQQREEILEQFPEVTEIPETLGARDAESELEHAAALIQRDHLLDAIEKEFNVSLKRAREELKKKEKGRTTWKKTSLAKRQLKVYKMKAIDNMSYPQIARALGIGLARAYSDFQQATKVIKQLRQGMDRLKREAETKKALSTGQRSIEEMFLLNLDRLERAIERGYPEEFIEFTLDRLASLYVRLVDFADEDDAPANQR